MDKEYISFDIKTGMKNIIGRDLITDDFIAIYELVKNSYDAYADYVSRFLNQTNNTSKGFDKETILNILLKCHNEI